MARSPETYMPSELASSSVADVSLDVQNLSFPPLDGSRYAVAASERRERWWYADGVWLNQGSTAAVVGFTCTHWLADRGLEVRDGELNEDYARQLYRDTRRAMGETEDGDGGARLDVAAAILRSRGLVEQCYALTDVASVVSALLERGPVLAGVNWHQSMFAATDVEGWTLCKLKPGSDVVGGHSVLLNGIALDLTIDGVTGFIRFKNSWGRDWGDSGHAMISIQDLADTVGQERCLLPIPAASALRTGLRQDEATEVAPYGPVEERYEQSAIGGDFWTRRDTVGAAAYADAIARGIQHVETKPPLTIGIKGAWGVGKTSLMRMIRDRLEWPGVNGNSDDLRPIHLTAQAAQRVGASKGWFASRQSSDLGDVTNRTVLAKVREDEQTSADENPAGSKAGASPLRAKLGPVGASTPAADEARWRPTVWFNPWMYQTGEQLWAGLANEIIKQITERMSRAEREHFWLHLNLKRVDEQAVRRKIYALVLNRLVPWALLALGLLLAGIALLAFDGAAWLGKSLTAAGPVALLAGTGMNAWRVLGSRVSAGMSELVEPATRVSRSAGAQLSQAYEELVKGPDYHSQSGALYLVHADIQRVLDLVATPERPLVIFVDDLDRCSPGTVVQVIEAINVFVAGDYRNSIFVIAMEPEMVAAHVEAAYGDFVQKMSQSSLTNGQDFELGWRFLEKIVQLPLALPAMEPEMTTAFFESLFPGELGPAAASSTLPTVSNGDGLEAALEFATLSEAATIAGSVRPDAAAKEAVRRVVERRLTTKDPEVQEVVVYASALLNRNPREIKRFVNLFRFFTMIFVERRLENLPTPKSLCEVAKLAVLGIRWPALLRALALPVGTGGKQTVFELLENPPAGEAGESQDARLERELKAAGLSESTVKRLTSPELTHFLRAEPIVGSGVRGYL